MKPIKTWILIANGATARIVENDGPGKGLYQPAGLIRHAPAATPFADQPGRSFQSEGQSRSKMDPHQKAQTDSNGFAAELVDDLASNHGKGRFDRLIICATPAMLSQVKELMPNDLQPHVLAELPKDLTHIPTDKLAPHFENYLAI